MIIQTRTMLLCLWIAAGSTELWSQQPQPDWIARADSGPAPRYEPLRRADSDSPRTTSTAPLNSCGDALSVALQQGTPEFLCWANIRTVERWNEASVVSGLQPGSDANVELPQYAPSMFRFTAGGFGGFSLPDASPGQAYGGIGAGAMLLERRRLQFMAEDGGGLADLNVGGSQNLVGLNRGAVRVTGEVTPRWTWQGTATNTWGTDAARIVAPLDFRRVGDADAPAADTVVYGLHSGRVVTGEEAAKLRYVDSRSSRWDFSASHAYTQYDADHFLVDTERGRVEYLHALDARTGIGGYAIGERQSSPLGCSLGGAGLRYVAGWGVRSGLNAAAGIAGGGASCGERGQVTGTAALYMPLRTSSDFYISAARDLSDGILEHAVFVNTGAAGIRHSVGKVADMRVSWNGLQGTDPSTKQSYHGMFEDLSLHFRIGYGFTQEFEMRHFELAGNPNNDRTISVITLWWSPGQTSEAAQASLP